MKNLIFCMCSLLLLTCEDTEVLPPVLYPEKYDDPLNMAFHTCILDSFFITAIAFDQLGNAWIGTFRQGLIRYNPQETVVYDTSNSPVPAIPIWDIAVDSRNNVWIGAESLLKFDGSQFTTFHSGNSDIPEDFISNIAVDSKDNIWFTSCRFREGGLVKFDGTHFTVFTPENSPLPINLIHGLEIDINDNIWLALTETVTQTYLVRISRGNWSLFTANDLGFAPYYISNIQINSDNKVCAGIDYSLSSSWPYYGPQVFVTDGRETVQLKFDSTSSIHEITVDRSDHIWCVTWDGYAVYDGDRWWVDTGTFGETSVFTIAQAPDARIWVGTSDGIYIND